MNENLQMNDQTDTDTQTENQTSNAALEAGSKKKKVTLLIIAAAAAHLGTGNRDEAQDFYDRTLTVLRGLEWGCAEWGRCGDCSICNCQE